MHRSTLPLRLQMELNAGRAEAGGAGLCRGQGVPIFEPSLVFVEASDSTPEARAVAAFLRAQPSFAMGDVEVEIAAVTTAKSALRAAQPAVASIRSSGEGIIRPST